MLRLLESKENQKIDLSIQSIILIKPIFPLHLAFFFFFFFFIMRNATLYSLVIFSSFSVDVTLSIHH
jgi:hypothetical protein